MNIFEMKQINGVWEFKYGFLAIPLIFFYVILILIMSLINFAGCVVKSFLDRTTEN